MSIVASRTLDQPIANCRECLEADLSLSRLYGALGAACALLLLWFAIWTATVAPLVLIGVRYWIIPWLLLNTTVLAAIAYAAAFPLVRSHFTLGSCEPIHEVANVPFGQALAAVGAGCLLLLAAHRFSNSGFLIAGSALVSFGAFRFAPSIKPPKLPANLRRVIAELIILFLICAALYFLGNRPDADDANYINLATGAQHTRGLVYQYDTMVGDGPHLIHLPTYKLQTFELLGAAIASVTGLTPIVVLHLVMPLPSLALFTLIMALITLPLAGRNWFAASLITIGLMYVNTDTLGTRGVEGILRLFQGKGALVSALVPLACALTVRFMLERRWIDLVGLGLCHICAVGLSANGLFVTPLASGFVALALLVAKPKENWKTSFFLLLSLAYPMAMALVVTIGGLSVPSEVVGPTAPYSQFYFVLGYHAVGLILTVLIAGAAILSDNPVGRRAAAIYLPLILLIVLNPLGWKVASLVTGNLGFRIFWSIPSSLIGGVVIARVFQGLVESRTSVPSALAGACALAGGILVNQAQADELRVRFGAPGLKVDHKAYSQAQRISSIASKWCDVLTPERIAVWLSGMPNAPHQAVVRTLYLKHYRFTEPADELALRWRLSHLVDGKADDNSPLPTQSTLLTHHINIGMIAADADNPQMTSLNLFADSLGLRERRAEDGMLYWIGQCHA